MNRRFSSIHKYSILLALTLLLSSAGLSLRAEVDSVAAAPAAAPRALAVRLKATGLAPAPAGARARGAADLAPALAALARETGAQARALGPSSPREWQIWEFASETAAREARRQLEKHPGVESVSVPGRRRLAARLPNDPEFAQQWAMLNTGQVMSGRAGAPGADIAAPDYWDANTGSAAVVVAIIDTGADVSHPDLAPNLWVNPGEIAGNGLDDDNNGYVDDIHGWATYNNTNTLTDTVNHGTAVASLVAAAGDNGVGMTGVAWSASLMILNAYGPTGDTGDDKLVAAIDYAIANGARIINASWGGPEETDLLREGMERARDAGVLVVAAAGNLHQNMDLFPGYPAAYRMPNVLSVGATTNLDGVARFSQRGGEAVDLLAPGDTMFVARAAGGYRFGSGTSFAAPVVSGAAALLFAAQPALDPYLAARRLAAAVEPISAASEQCRSHGRLYLPALAIADSTPPAAIEDLEVWRVGPNGAALRWTAPGNDGAAGGPALFYEIRYSTAPLDAANFYRAALPLRLPRPGPAGETQALYLNGLDPSTTYYVAARAVDGAGNLGSLEPGSVVNFTTSAPEGLAFEADFESGSSAWQAQSPWALAGGMARSGLWAWSSSPTGAPAAAGSYSLTSPVFDLSGVERPVLTFAARRLFDPDYADASSPAAPGVYGVVEFSADGGSQWTEVARYHSSREPFEREAVPLPSGAGAAQARLRWRLVVASGAHFTRWILDDVRVFDTADGAWLPEPLSLLVEPVGPQGQFPNPQDPASYLELSPPSGWATGAQRDAIARVNSTAARQAGALEAPSAQALYMPLFQAAGRYRVQVQWPASANAAHVRYVVRSLEGEAEFPVDQNGAVNGERWIELGEFYFAPGRSASRGALLLDATGVSGVADGSRSLLITADSVRFDYLGPGAPASASAHWRTLAD